MGNHLRKPLACALMLALQCGSASAAIFAVNSNVPNGSFLNNTTFSGIFNLTPYLSSPTFNAPYTINSASVAFSFSDNGGESYYTGSSASGSNPYYNYYWDPAESVALNLAGESGGGATSYYSTSQYAGQGSTSYSCGLFNLSTCYSYYDIYNVTSGYTGSFNIANSLTGIGLSALQSTGVLNFSGNVSGNLYLNSATLTVDVSPNPVPIPAAAWLLGSGLLGLAGVARRKAA